MSEDALYSRLDKYSSDDDIAQETYQHVHQKPLSLNWMSLAVGFLSGVIFTTIAFSIFYNMPSSDADLDILRSFAHLLITLCMFFGLAESG